MLERAKAALAKADAEKEVASTSTVFGDLPLVQSASISDRVWTRVCDLGVAQVGATVLVRARLFVLRETGKVLFLTLRQGTSTVQAVIFKNDDKDLFKWATGESVALSMPPLRAMFVVKTDFIATSHTPTNSTLQAFRGSPC